MTQRAGNTYGSDYAYNGDAGGTTLTSGGGGSGSPAPVGSTSGPAGVAGGTPGGSAFRSTPPFMGGPKQPAEPAAGGGPRMAQTSQLPGGAPSPQPAVAANLVPAGVNMSALQYAGWLMQRAHAHANAGDNEGAKLFQQQAQPLFDALKQAGEIPNEVKLAQSQGMTPLQYERAKTQQGKDVDVYTKLNTGIQAMANTSVGMLPTLQAARSLIDAGAATGWNLTGYSLGDK